VARLTCALAAAALACALAGAATAADYHNTAQALMPTPAQVGFRQVLEFKRATKPARKLAKGWKSGVAAIFAKGASKAAVDSAITAFIYDNAADAKAAWQNACPKCPHIVAKGVQLRYAAGKSSSGIPLVQVLTVCHNVYTTVLTEGSETQTKLAGDAELIALAIYKRANHFGMSACT
jgi:hypothetical protein